MRGVKIRLEWMTGHNKLWGNEKADDLTEAGMLQGLDGDAIASYRWLKTKSKRDTIREWEKLYRNCKGKQGMAHRLTPLTKNKTQKRPNDRAAKITISRFRTGHAIINAYLFHVGKIESG